MLTMMLLKSNFNTKEIIAALSVAIISLKLIKGGA
jgi:hypothetical protein